MKIFNKISINFLILSGIAAAIICSSCHIYSFKDIGAIPDSVKTVHVGFLENRAPYVNPQLSPTLTDRLKQKIVNQTRLNQVNNDNAHYDIKGYISDYSLSTSGITSTNGRSQSSINRLTVTVHITFTDQLRNLPPQEFDVSRNFDFSANQSLQTVESSLLDEIVKNITDDIFNHIFSNW